MCDGRRVWVLAGPADATMHAKKVLNFAWTGLDNEQSGTDGTRRQGMVGSEFGAQEKVLRVAVGCVNSVRKTFAVAADSANHSHDLSIEMMASSNVTITSGRCR